MGNFFHSIVGNKIILQNETIIQQEVEVDIREKKGGGEYNEPFSRFELNYALNSLPINKAMEPDDIPYESLKHLPENWLIHLFSPSELVLHKGYLRHPLPKTSYRH